MLVVRAALGKAGLILAHFLLVSRAQARRVGWHRVKKLLHKQ
jgi:hypothetical protein